MNGLEPIIIAGLVAGAVLTAFGLVMFLLMSLENQNQ